MDDRFRFRAYLRKLHRIVDVVSIHWTYRQIMWMDGVTFIIEPFDEIILMQSTGLRDKNGTLIYEGDVVKYLGYEVQDGKQVRPERFRAVGQTTDPFRNSFIDDCFHIQNLLEHGNYELEIIGNVYSNPDLVKG